MAGRSYAGAAALALVVVSAVGCGGGGGGGTPAPDPRTGPEDVGYATRRVAMTPGVFLLGAGFDAVRREPRGRCVDGGVLHSTLSGPPRVRRLARPFTQAEVTDLLGANDPVERVRRQVAGRLPGEVEAFAGDPRAVTLVYGVEFATRWGLLDVDAVTLTSTAPAAGTTDFARVCGDEVAVEQELGAQAFLVYRLWFRDDAARATFDSLVGRTVPLWDLHAHLAAADRELGDRYGGRVSRISHGVSGHDTVIVDEGNVRELVRLPPSLDLADGFVEYVTTDGPGGLRAQAEATPGVIGVTLKPWTVTLLPASAPRATPAPVLTARDDLAARLDARLRVRDRIRARQDLGASLLTEQAAVDRDLGVLRAALEACHALAGPNDATAVSRCTAGATSEALSSAGYTGSPALAEL